MTQNASPPAGKGTGGRVTKTTQHHRSTRAGRDQAPRVADRGPCPKLSSQTVRGLPFGAAAPSLVRSQTTTNDAHSPEGWRRKPTSPHPPSVPLSTSPSPSQKHQLNTTPIFAVFRPGKTLLSRAPPAPSFAFPPGWHKRAIKLLPAGRPGRASVGSFRRHKTTSQAHASNDPAR